MDAARSPATGASYARGALGLRTQARECANKPKTTATDFAWCRRLGTRMVLDVSLSVRVIIAVDEEQEQR